MRTIAAYVLTFVLAPAISALAGLAGALLPVNFITALLTQAVVGLAAVWIGTLIFSWLGVVPGWPMAIMLLIGFVWNDLSHPAPGSVDRLGSVVGIVAGAIWLL